jgi:hypothetical protein
VQIAVASTVIAVVIITRIYFYFASQVTPGELFELVPGLKNVDLNASHGAQTHRAAPTPLNPVMTAVVASPL